MSLLKRVLTDGAMNGFQTWNMECALSQKRFTSQQSQLNNALSAEDAVGTAFDVGGAGNYFLRKRVYVSEQGRNREIDCIGICNGKVYVVEVKNWRGDVWSNGIRWFQKAMVSSTQALEFGDIYEEADFKTNALHKHFEYDHKVRIPRECMITCIVFTNPAVKLDPKSVGSRPFVFTLDGFVQYLRTQSQIQMRSEMGMGVALFQQGISMVGSTYGAARDVLSGAIEKFTKPKTELTPAQIKRNQERQEKKKAIQDLKAILSDKSIERASAAVKLLPSLTRDDTFKIRMMCESIRTWDFIELHNGVVVHGDVIAVDVPSISCNYLRAHMTNIQMQWASQGPIGFIQSLWNGTACSVMLELIPSKQRGKRKDQRAVAAAEAAGGAEKLTGNRSLQKYKDADGNIKFPVRIQYSKDMKKNDRLIYKCAGKPQAQEVPLAHVKLIEFSKNKSHKATDFVEK